ncbi:hypothetical protein IFM89_029218 [Coptis chinensis]|uniref:FKB95-like N-terminal Kelch domain-containing protein n=1 Tax=Coptis chinensis TaxID=261450 RepID=A0A835M6Y6_9MAGN|nr:hypothetical protein IFM89_029218 [Coptis chinensis]
MGKNKYRDDDSYYLELENAVKSIKKSPELVISPSPYPSKGTDCRSRNVTTSLPLVSNIGAASAALGSKIYMVGGDYNRKWPWEVSSEVFSLDTRNSNGVWQKERSCMMGKRSFTNAVATRGKMYVFGTATDRPTPKLWAEVFDPALDTWSSLPDPPPELMGTFHSPFTAVVDNGKKILLGVVDVGLFSFHVISETWKRISNTPLFNLSRWFSTAATLDDVLYTCSGDRVFAYDLVGEEWFKEPVHGIGIASFSVLPRSEINGGLVVESGNKTLCVVWSDYEWNEKEETGIKMIRCVKFRVTRVENSEGQHYLRAHVECRSAYLSGDTTSSLYDCFAL